MKIASFILHDARASNFFNIYGEAVEAFFTIRISPPPAAQNDLYDFFQNFSKIFLEGAEKRRDAAFLSGRAPQSCTPMYTPAEPDPPSLASLAFEPPRRFEDFPFTRVITRSDVCNLPCLTGEPQRRADCLTAEIRKKKEERKIAEELKKPAETDPSERGKA